MTLATDAAKPPRNSYIEDGASRIHAVAFQFDKATDLRVRRILDGGNGAGTLLTLGADYSVQGGNFAPGAITKANGGIPGAQLVIDRVTARDQQVDLAHGAAAPASYEHGLDRLTMIVQEIFRDMLTSTNLLATLRTLLEQGTGIELGLSPAGKVVISCTVAGIDQLADVWLLEGDQQGGGASGTGQPANSAETIRDVIGLALKGFGGIVVTPNDAGDEINFSVGPGTAFLNLILAEKVQILLDALVPANGLYVTGRPDGKLQLNSDRLAPSYRGLVPIYAVDENFSFYDAQGGRSIQVVPAADRFAFLQPNIGEPLSDGWTTVIRNIGVANLKITRVAGVDLYKNGSLNSADAVLAPGGICTIIRWGADYFSIDGHGLS